jgi:hypothetical protein
MASIFFFFQVNKDKGKSWFISIVEIGCKNGRPYLKFLRA